MRFLGGIEKSYQLNIEESIKRRWHLQYRYHQHRQILR